MSEAQTQTEPHKSTEALFDRAKDLNKVEQVLNNSTAPEGFNFSALNQQLADGLLEPGALRIIGVTGTLSEEEAHALQERREEQEDLVGIFWFLDHDGEDEIAKRGFKIRFQPVGYVHKSGTSEPIWKITAFKPGEKPGEGVEASDPEIGNLIKLNEFSESHFGLGPTLKPCSRFLFPISLKEKYAV